MGRQTSQPHIMASFHGVAQTSRAPSSKLGSEFGRDKSSEFLPVCAGGHMAVPSIIDIFLRSLYSIAIKALAFWREDDDGRATGAVEFDLSWSRLWRPSHVVVLAASCGRSVLNRMVAAATCGCGAVLIETSHADGPAWHKWLYATWPHANVLGVRAPPGQYPAERPQ
jgi:hypothetical protein